MSAPNDRFQNIEGQLGEFRRRLKHLEERLTDTTKPSSEAPEKKKAGESVTNLLLALFTGLLVLTSVFQWQAARDATTDARRSFQTGTRAWVVVKDAMIRATEPIDSSRSNCAKSKA